MLVGGGRITNTNLKIIEEREKEIYQSPLIEVSELIVESGFASSGDPADGSGAGSSGWSEW